MTSANSATEDEEEPPAHSSGSNIPINQGPHDRAEAAAAHADHEALPPRKMRPSRAVHIPLGGAAAHADY